jgi:hypothetical protein
MGQIVRPLRQDARDRYRLQLNDYQLFRSSSVTFPSFGHLAFRGWSGLLEPGSPSNKEITMTNSMKSMCIAAAVAGMLGAAPAVSHAQPLSSSNTAVASGMAGTAAQTTKTAKHACKGLNACKGQGADHKNSCKGKGSCATDGSKPKM